MIRPITCICMMLAAGSGLYLYQVKHRTEMLDRKIEATLKSTEAVHERIRLLSAEWALLNDPSRLADMAARFLSLHPVAPNQFVTMAELDKHLPAVQSYPAPGAPLPVPETPMAAGTPPAPAIVPTAVATTEPAHRPNPTVSASMATAAIPAAPTPVPPAQTHVQTFAAAKPVAHPALETKPAERRETLVAALPMPHGPVGAVPGPMATPVTNNPVMMNPVLSRVMATTPTPRPSHEPEYVASNAVSNLGAPLGSSSQSAAHTARFTPHVTSVLGGTHSVLAPPVPVGPTARVGYSATTADGYVEAQ